MAKMFSQLQKWHYSNLARMYCIKGVIIQKIESNSDAIAKNTQDIRTQSTIFQNLKKEEGYIINSNLVAYPARKDGCDMTSGYYKAILLFLSSCHF